MQLIDTETGFHIFSRSFEIDVGVVNEMQQEIAGLVISNLKLAVDRDSIRIDNLYATAPSDDAYHLYLLGREALNGPRSVADFTEAIGYYDQALEIDENYPAAHAGRCAAFTGLYELQSDTAHIKLAEDACTKALTIAPRLPLIINTVARLYLRTGR